MSQKLLNPAPREEPPEFVPVDEDTLAFVRAFRRDVTEKMDELCGIAELERILKEW